jgi:hypothetical protein
MIEAENTNPKKRNTLTKWALRVFLGFLSIVIIFSLAVQIPFIQKRIVEYVTEYATTAFGISVEIESVALYPLRGNFSLDGVTCTSDGVVLDFESVNLLSFRFGEEGRTFLKSVELEGVDFYAESVRDLNVFIENLNNDGDLGEREINSAKGEIEASTFIEHFELADLKWRIGDSLSGGLELISLNSIEIISNRQDRKMEVVVGGFALSMLSAEVVLEDHGGEGRYENFTLKESFGSLSAVEEVVKIQVESFDAIGVQFNGGIEIDLGADRDEQSGSMSLLPALDIDITVQPSVYARWGGDEIVDIVSNLKSDEVKGRVVIEEGVIRIENLANSQVSISGKVIEVEKVWDINIDIDTELVKPWIDQMEINNAEIEGYIANIKNIRLDAQGGLNSSNGVIVLTSNVREGRNHDNEKMEVGYDLVINEGGWRSGLSCGVSIDSLSGKFGIVQDLTGKLEIQNGHAEFRWENEILRARTSNEDLLLYSHLNGYCEMELGGAEPNGIKARLDFSNSIIVGDNREPINFERFDLTLEIHDSGLLDFEIESELIIGEGVINIDEKVWSVWMERTVMREVPVWNKKDEEGSLLTKGQCEILRIEPLAAIFGIPASASKGTKLNWLISDNSIEVKAHAEWLGYEEFVLNEVFVNVEGRTEENWINIEVLDVVKSDLVIGSEINVDVHADTVWTTDCGWKNSEGIEGFVRVEGALENGNKWGFNVYEATIPLGRDTLELTRIPSPLVISDTEISSEGMSWKGGGFQAEIEGEIGGKGDKPLLFLIHTDRLDSSRTKSWFNTPVNAENISLYGNLGGTLKNPTVSMSGVGEGISYGGETIAKSEFEITYSGDEMKVDLDFSGFGDSGNGKIITRGKIKNILSGDYTLDLMSAMTDLPLSWTNTILDEKMAKLGGELDAAITIKGKLSSPALLGGGTLKNALVAIAYLGTEYDVTGGFGITPDGIELNGLQVRDGKGGEGFLVGTALHENFKKWNLDISLSIENKNAPLELMNIPRSPDAYFYGTGNAWGDVNIFGYEDQITIEARVKTSQGTEFVLPMDAATSSTWSSFVKIVDHSENESTNDHFSSEPSENERKSSVKLDLIIDVTDESIARIVFDEAVGDEIIGRCKGIIQVTIDDFERLAMFGSLEIVEGEYLFTLSNFINKKFVAEPGGTIKWFGDPYKAEIDLKTYYSTRTSLRPISPEVSENTKQRVDLILEMDGDLLRPGIQFDIRLPESDARTKATLASLLTNEEEMNRQAISLLVLQQFLPAQWQAAAIGSTGLQENSTELISAQLGNWLSGMSDDVNIGIDYDASNNIGDEAALAVALSTQLLNDRLHVEGEVGTQHLNSGSLEDLQLRDFRLRYDLKDDGSLQLTGYSTQRATIPGLEGESVQGVGIVFHRDFDNLRDLFKKREE